MCGVQSSATSLVGCQSSLPVAPRAKLKRTLNLRPERMLVAEQVLRALVSWAVDSSPQSLRTPLEMLSVFSFV